MHAKVFLAKIIGSKNFFFAAHLLSILSKNILLTAQKLTKINKHILPNFT